MNVFDRKSCVSRFSLKTFIILIRNERKSRLKFRILEHQFRQRQAVLLLTISSLGLTNSRACRLIAWNAAFGAYPG